MYQKQITVNLDNSLSYFSRVQSVLGIYIYIKKCESLKNPMHRNLNLNSLLVKRQFDNPSPGAVSGEIGP